MLITQRQMEILATVTVRELQEKLGCLKPHEALVLHILAKAFFKYYDGRLFPGFDGPKLHQINERQTKRQFLLQPFHSGSLNRTDCI
ncbi:hypothetical protein PROFUN_16761 [Planoprotostelium fungivorum]|uniref:Uncharacterized protein n=1 Tax=Planoprotostelium fungivorum TaxID=1890364 RepID=A0A2P6MPL2_9EUKA|nr:hypothetical protein PROFUN_16761 [Planoprotostelium fungivorum]